MKTGRRDNAGFSIVEMIVILAILAVVSASSVTSLSLYTNAKCKKAIQTIYGAIGEAKVTTQAKSVSGNVSIEFYRDDDGNLWSHMTLKRNDGRPDWESKDIIADRNTKVYFTVGDGDTGTPIEQKTKGDGEAATDAYRPYIKFDRSTGAVTQFTIGAVSGVEGALPDALCIWSGDANKSLAKYKLTLVQVTGKCYMGEKITTP